MIEFDCPSCRTRLRVPGDAAGKVARCPRCQARPRVPDLIPAVEVVEPDPVPESPFEIGLIRACRERFGPPPRALAAADAAACRIRLMSSQEASYRKGPDRLLLILADQELLLARGTVVWGHLVQANQILFDPENERTAPANVIYSPDPYFDGRADVLAAFARDLYAQKGVLPGDHEIGSFVRAVTDEYLRVMRLEVPRGYCAGRPAYFTTCFIEPHHLPDNYLARSELPLLVNFDETEAVMVLPARFWPPELLARWRVPPGRRDGSHRTGAPAGQVRCPFCHQYVTERAYPAHRAGHVKRPADRPADATTPAGPEARDLAGVPAVYRHRACGGTTRVPAEIIRSYLRNPYLYSADRAFCSGCGEHVPLRECVWTETGKDLQSYTDRLRAARPELKPGGAPPDPAEVVRRNRLAADRGDAAAMNDLGYAYEHGEGVAADPRSAMNWYRRAAAGGSAIAMSNLGIMLSSGRGVPVDHAEAVQWLRRAADLGHAAAMFNLGFAYENGKGVEPDPSEAVRWYRKAAEAGHVRGMSALGNMLSSGRGGPVDHAEAVKWLRRAAHMGSAVAMCNLGYAYAHGEGVALDRAEATRWYLKAAELGEPMAMHNLGSVYETGKGVPVNIDEAVKWYRPPFSPVLPREGSTTIPVRTLPAPQCAPLRPHPREPFMAEPYTIVIGLEVHVQLLTKTKLFCGCKNQFGLPPNTATCPVCLGLPGSLPVMNRKAFDLALRAALALNCRIAGFTKWDRKNYYYPDLPKNYQISQYDLPFSHDGWLEINIAKDTKKDYVPKKIGIIRAHLEEDAGKNLHDESGKGGDTLVDLNRTGTPLLEIVSHPDMTSPAEAIAYLEEVRLMLREIGVSDCEMQEGSLRCDANVNIHVPVIGTEHATGGKDHHATPLVEIKNLNSFRAVGRAIEYEAKRHYEEYKKDTKGDFRFGKMLKTTAGWDDARGITVVQRHKEEAADYRYFPEPDLVPVVVSEAQIADARAAMGELPQAQRKRLATEYGLTAYDAQVLTAKGRPTVAYFEAVAKALNDGKTASNRMSDLIYPALTERKEEITAFPLDAAQFADFISRGPSNSQDRRDVFKAMLEKGLTLQQAKDFVGIKEVDADALRAAVVAAVGANPKAVADFRAGKDAAKMAIVGAVMKANKGVPNDLVRRLVDEELARV